MMTHFKAISIVLFPLAIAGCKTSPRSGFDDVQKMVNTRTGQVIEWPRTVSENDTVETTVRRLLQENLTAETAAQIALLNNRSLRATLEELGISRADVIQAGLLANPNFSAQIRFPDRPPSAANTEFSLVGDFLDLLLLPLRKRVATVQFEQTKLRVAHEILQLRSEVKSAFYTAQARQQLLPRLKAIVEITEAGVDLSLRQHSAGNINDLELANQVASFQQAKIEWGKTEAQFRADRERVNRLLGLWGANTQWKVADQLPAIPTKEVALNDLESIAIKQRLDLAAARQQVALSGRALALRTNTRYLPAAIRIGVDTERETDRQRVTGPNLDLELPLFDQGQGAIARLQSQYRQAQWRVDALATDIRSEVRQARDSAIAARDLAEYYAKLYLPQRIRVVNETLLQYNAMQKGTFELLMAKERELTAEREYAEAWRDYWIANAELERAVGGSLTQVAPQMAAPAKTDSKKTEEQGHQH